MRARWGGAPAVEAASVAVEDTAGAGAPT